ncbi:MAG: 50S ribosomal protein L31, large subunit ribosomal protein L31, partial [Microgenomates group bacterium GW2011_GWC1_49_7]
MKTAIHPQWFNDAKVTCACGNKFVVGATKPELRVEICSKCHPFFTGEMKFVDTMGRVERFQTKQKTAAAQATVLAAKKKKK